MRSKRERRRSSGSGSRGIRIWSGCARVTVGLGLVCALAVWPDIWLLIAMSALAAVSLLSRPARRRRATRILQRSGPLALGLLGSAGLVALLGWPGVGVTAALWATGLLVGRGRPFTRRWTTDVPWQELEEAFAEPASDDDPDADLPAGDEVATLDDSALCHAWRRSFVQLQASRSVPRRAEVVQLRQQYLDELDRRHPTELRSWLASGARAAGNPLPYLGRPTRHPRP